MTNKKQKTVNQFMGKKSKPIPKSWNKYKAKPAPINPLNIYGEGAIPSYLRQEGKKT
jgi:hypothetical protein